MKRSQTIVLIFASLGSLWLSLYLDLLPLPLSKAEKQVIETLPLWAVVTMGAYSLASIGYQLLIFRECPEAFKELEKDLAAARENLIKKGFKFE